MAHARFAGTLLAVAALVAVQSPTVAEEVTHLESLAKTMSVFEAAFEKRDEELLRTVAATRFQQSPFFHTLIANVAKLRVNSAISSQVAEQAFRVEPGGPNITVPFTLEDGRWIVALSSSADAGRVGPGRGLPVLARELYFSDFRKVVKAGALSGLRGTSEYATLQRCADDGKELVALPETSVTITDLILHDGKGVTDLIYLRLHKSPVTDDSRRGWLVVDGGTMLQYHKTDRRTRALLDLLTENDKAFDLTRPSAFVFSNVMASNDSGTFPSRSVFRIVRVVASGFKWEQGAVRFDISIDCVGASWAPPFRVSVDEGRLILDTGSDAKFVIGKPVSHRYLALELVDGALELRVKPNSADAPIRSFGDVIVKRQEARSRDDGVTFVVKMVATRGLRK